MLRMIPFGLIAAVLIPMPVFAANDLAITSLIADKAAVETGEDFTLTLRVRNNGPDAARDVIVGFRDSHQNSGFGLAVPTPPGRMHGLAATAPPGWQCSLWLLNCSAASMPANTEVRITYRIAAPEALGEGAFSVSAIAGLANDPDTQNNSASVPIALHTSNRIASLSLSISAAANPVPRNGEATVRYDVRNEGPNDVNDVGVLVVFAADGQRVFSGAGWTCTNHDRYASTCRRASLAANTTATLTMQFAAPDANTLVTTDAEVYAVQGHLDPDLTDNTVIRSLSIGTASDWARILIPFTRRESRGASGSIWQTEVTGVIASETRPETVPAGCGPIEEFCVPPPLNEVFDAFAEFLVYDSSRPQFLYVAREHASKVILATRVYDTTKSDSTAGAFVPMARDDDFAAEGFTLIAIPVSPKFRTALRVYDSSGRNAGQAELTLYGDAETEPFLRTPIMLEGTELRITTALLPYSPAFAQIDLTSLIPAKYSHVRATVTPTSQLPADMRLWGFVSITNNETSHVTVVAP